MIKYYLGLVDYKWEVFSVNEGENSSADATGYDAVSKSFDSYEEAESEIDYMPVYTR